MPTSAVTGTKTAHEPAAEEAPDLSGEDGYVQPPVGDPQDLVDSSGKAPKAVVPQPQPLMDPNGNGSIQVTCADGSTTNIDAGTPGWEDKLRDLNPKHPALKYADEAAKAEKAKKAKAAKARKARKAAKAKAEAKAEAEKAEEPKPDEPKPEPDVPPKPEPEVGHGPFDPFKA